MKYKVMVRNTYGARPWVFSVEDDRQTALDVASEVSLQADVEAAWIMVELNDDYDTWDIVDETPDPERIDEALEQEADIIEGEQRDEYYRDLEDN